MKEIEMFYLQIRKMLRHLLGNLQGFDPSLLRISYTELLPQDQCLLSMLHMYGTQVGALSTALK